MSLIQCNIVSPEGELFSGEIEMLTADGGDGEIAITPRHAPLLTNLKPGPVKLVLEGGAEEVFFASGGFLEVQPGVITLLTDVAERADDIDAAEAERAMELAERELKDQKSEMDYSLATAQLAEAAARLKALQKLRKK
ncbi:MAG TPA: F0F1 ATP synthase subunit epsilon [Gammaproteobacteria bacterium]|jgi:F-type H+-transporting ATPase subunit epsilon|nr:F0F1 ATP synthase subunit epsilon [Gammaproteobacteria bacterium]HIB74670.1 F0F1 ATP synthase subunit epsilon [Gammaproteobacteria bacterium]HIM22086.1 F0F1 ATP synthase subunit epsilon [Gammaproteobacteria bacterium]HIN73372.1 F0F1 ATP synthase subunit epsilon [Gammaproteobacteria bacterium]|tara:strand:- start:334 stop:747 length:414 start_codon:yes stop_codon:yes gene_type:complete